MEKLRESVFEDAAGYFRARIPGIVCTDKGNLIAYCELRKSDSDWAVIDIGMKKSTDGGKSWSERRIIISSEGKNTVNNPVMITDGDILHFIYCINYREVFYMKSTDEGENWSEARSITDDIRKSLNGFFFSCIASGPTHGIKVSPGRLIVPLWLAYNRADSESHHPSVICVMYSDDGGESWKTGEICDELTDASESVAAEADGRIYLNIRHEGIFKCRYMAEIDEKCSIVNLHPDEDLPDPVCCAGFIAYKNGFLFSNCASAVSRIMLTLKKLDKKGQVAESLLISEKGGYSDIAVSSDNKTAYVLHEYENILICTAVKL